MKGVSLWSLRESGVIAVARPGYSTTEAKKLLEQKYGSEKPFVHVVEDNSIGEMSSTVIREKLDSGQSLKDLVPEAVEKRLRVCDTRCSIKFNYSGKEFTLLIRSAVSLLGFQQEAKASPESVLEITLSKGQPVILTRQSDRIEHFNGVFTAILGVSTGGPILEPQRIPLPQFDQAKLVLQDPMKSL